MTTIDTDFSRLTRAAAELGRRGVITDEAVRANETVLGVDPENVDALLRLLRCRVGRSEFLQAADVIERLDGLELDMSDRSYVDRFRTTAISGAATEVARVQSAEVFRQKREALLASARDVTSAHEAQALGTAYRGVDNELAIAFLERGLEVAATWEESLSLLAVLAPTYRDSGEPSLALGAYARAIEIEPAYELNKVVYTSMTATLRQVGRLDEAREHGEQLARHFPDDAYVLRALGAVYVRLASRDQDLALAKSAEDCFLKAAERDPTARDNLRQLRSLATTLDELCTLLEQAGDNQGLDAVKVQKRRIDEHLARLGRS